MELVQIFAFAGASALFASRSLVERPRISDHETIVHAGVRYEGGDGRVSAWEEATNRLLWEHKAPGDAGEIVALHAQDGWLVGASETGRTFSLPLDC